MKLPISTASKARSPLATLNNLWSTRAQPWLSGESRTQPLPDLLLRDPQSAAVIEEQLKQTRRIVRLTMVGLVGLIVWACIAQVPQAANGESKIIPSQKLQIVQAVDGGVITEVMVQEGQAVKLGQTLVQIDTTRFASNLKEKEAIDASLTFRQARLEAQISGTSMNVPADMKARYPELYFDENRLLQTKLSEWSAQASVYSQQVDQRQRELDEANSRRTAAQSNYEMSRKELDTLKPLLKTGAISPVEILRLEKDVARTQGDYEASRAQIERINSAIREARQKLQEIRLRQENEARSELAEIKTRIASLEQNQVELNDRVNQATLKAPVDGIVQRVLYNTKGAVVPPGREVIEIVPADEDLIFETRIQPKDIGFIKPGQPATIRVSAYDSAIFGSLKGTVLQVSADSLQDDAGRSFFAVKVSVPKSALSKNLQLMPGMTAQVSIETMQRSVMNYLLKPVIRGFQQAFTEK